MTCCSCLVCTSYVIFLRSYPLDLIVKHFGRLWVLEKGAMNKCWLADCCNWQMSRPVTVSDRPVLTSTQLLSIYPLYTSLSHCRDGKLTLFEIFQSAFDIRDKSPERRTSGHYHNALLFESRLRLRERFSLETGAIKSFSLLMASRDSAKMIRFMCHSIICSPEAFSLRTQL